MDQAVTPAKRDAAWLRRADEISAFLLEQFFISDQQCAYILPRAISGGYKGCTPKIISAHFAAKRDADLIAVHPLATIGDHQRTYSAWMGTVFRPTTGPETWGLVRTVHDALLDWGFQPSIEESGGQYRMWVGFASHEGSRAELWESHPMRLLERILGLRGWVAISDYMQLPGKVIGQTQWSRFYDGSTWRQGDEAIDIWLASLRHDPRLVSMGNQRIEEMSGAGTPKVTSNALEMNEPMKNQEPVDRAVLVEAAEGENDWLDDSPPDPAAEWQRYTAMRRCFLVFDALFPYLLILFFAIVLLAYFLEFVGLLFLLPYVLLGAVVWVILRWRRTRQ